MLASNEVREIYSAKYKDKVTNISKRKANRLACIFTTSLYGKSSQYNRIKFEAPAMSTDVDQRGAPWYDRILFGAAKQDIAMPAALVVDGTGKIVFAYRSARLDDRARPADILDSL